MEIIQIKVGLMENLTYIISLNNSFIVIDPSWGYDEIKKYYEKSSKEFKAVFLTHGHFDHVMDVEKIVNNFNTDVYICKEDLSVMGVRLDFRFVNDDELINIDEITIKAIHTPGHTPGSMCYMIENNLFTGDTLFYGCCGRVDLPHSNADDMRLSLLKLSKLEDDIVVWPGHFYEKNKSSIGFEKRNNIYMKLAQNKDDFSTII